MNCTSCNSCNWPSFFILYYKENKSLFIIEKEKVIFVIYIVYSYYINNKDEWFVMYIFANAHIYITSFLLYIQVLTLRYSLRSYLKSKPSSNIPWYIQAFPLMSSLRSLIKSQPSLSITTGTYGRFL